MGLGPARDARAQGVSVRDRSEGVVARAPRINTAAGGLGDELERESPAVEDEPVAPPCGADWPADAEARRELRAGAEVRRDHLGELGDRRRVGARWPGRHERAADGAALNP